MDLFAGLGWIGPPWLFGLKVRMNDMLSYLLTYKLKGEDVVRNSGIPATIIRPCALTEEPAGAPMIVAQGDNIKGKISRYVFSFALLFSHHSSP